MVPVSIPLSEFCWLKPRPARISTDSLYGFNSPLGILLVEAWLKPQFNASICLVSIPLSEFCWLKPVNNHTLYSSMVCFNSPLGILLVEAFPELHKGHPKRSFNSPLGILLVEAFCWLKHPDSRCPFQFPSRNSVG